MPTEINDSQYYPLPAETSAGVTYTRVSHDWHRLKTPHGLFFGYSRQQVFEKAVAAAAGRAA